METKTKDMKLFHKLVRNNRKKGTDTITELTANGNDYKGEENVVKAFQDHFRK
jgi:N-acetyl-anhydromuramyl-L-alanine amidase AmpD